MTSRPISRRQFLGGVIAAAAGTGTVSYLSHDDQSTQTLSEVSREQLDEFTKLRKDVYDARLDLERKLHEGPLEENQRDKAVEIVSGYEKLGEKAAELERPFEALIYYSGALRMANDYQTILKREEDWCTSPLEAALASTAQQARENLADKKEQKRERGENSLNRAYKLERITQATGTHHQVQSLLTSALANNPELALTEKPPIVEKLSYKIRDALLEENSGIDQSQFNNIYNPEILGFQADIYSALKHATEKPEFKKRFEVTTKSYIEQRKSLMGAYPIIYDDGRDPKLHDILPPKPLSFGGPK